MTDGAFVLPRGTLPDVLHQLALARRPASRHERSVHEAGDRTAALLLGTVEVVGRLKPSATADSTQALLSGWV